jgi:hypothetical protein
LLSAEEQVLFKTSSGRPTNLPLQAVSNSGRFRIHYTLQGDAGVAPSDLNSNGTPDFIEEIAAAADLSYDVQVAQLGFRDLQDDDSTDGPEYDIFVHDEPFSSYGYTQPEATIPSTPNNDYTSFIVIDNDFDNGHFTNGIDGARVTVAHELQHAIQFSYRYLEGLEAFYYEACAVWMEDVVYDDINDYLQYLDEYFANRDLPFVTNVRLNYEAYGSGIWNLFLAKKFSPDLSDPIGDATVVRRTWELMALGDPLLDALDRTLRERSSSFASAFAEYSVWNYFTGLRADPIHFYEEGATYPEVSFQREFEDLVVVEDSTTALTHHYYKLVNREEAAYEIQAEVTGGDWQFAAIVEPQSGESEFITFNPASKGKLGLVPAFSRIIVIPMVTVEDSPTNYHQFSFRIQEVQELDIFPNPFLASSQDEVLFRFAAIDDEDTRVQIMTASGQLVTSVSELQSNGDDLLAWDGRDDDGHPVASGVYILKLQQGSNTIFRKFAVIR